MIEAGFHHQSLAAIEGVAEVLDWLRLPALRCVEQQPGANPPQTGVNQPPEMLGRNRNRLLRGQSLRAGSRGVSAARGAALVIADMRELIGKLG
jgi:hypothetical protein